MIRKWLWIACSIVFLLQTSCQKDPVLSIAGLTNIELDASGGSQTISFQTNRNWTVSWSESWLNVSPSSGSASNGTITINVSASANQGIARSATITIKAEGLTQTVNVEQQSGDLLVGTWGQTHYEYRHWSNGQLVSSEDIDGNPFAPNSDDDLKMMFTHVAGTQYTMTIYRWNPTSSQWYTDLTRSISRQNDKLLSIDPDDGDLAVEVTVLTADKLVIYGSARDIPSQGDEYYEKVTFTRMD